MAGFRELCDAMHGAILDRHAADLSAHSFEMTFHPDTSDASGGASAQRATLVEVRLEDVRWVRWAARAGDAGPLRVAAAGVERLAEGDVWRIYLNAGGAEIEAACGRLLRDGNEIAGTGRAYRSTRGGPAGPPEG